MSDYIKREDAIRIIRESPFKKHTTEICYFVGRLNELPPADVVEADKAQKEIDYWHDKAQSYEQTILKLSLNKADVVEVVRCKDCKHYKRNIPCVGGHYNGCDEWIDEGNAITVYDNDFCSYGERTDT